jgi:hypothetical protein
MNKEIWRNDKELMVIANSIGSDLVSAMDGERKFSRILDDAFATRVKELYSDISNRNRFGHFLEFEDRFMQSAAFTIGLWSKELVDFVFDRQYDEQITDSLLIKNLIEEKKPISISSILSELFKKYKKDDSELYFAFHKEQANLVPLLCSNKILPKFAGEIKELEKPDRVAETDFPQYTIGYMKPSITEKIDKAMAESHKGPWMLGGGVVILAMVTKEISYEAGTLVGTLESKSVRK